MSKTSIEALEDQVRAFISSNFHVAGTAVLGRDTSLLDTGIVDSTGFLEIFSWLRDEFGVSVADSEMNPDNFETVAKIAAYVHRKQE
ncbi:MAG: acyl carrier protein [Polyangiales bacterium]